MRRWRMYVVPACVAAGLLAGLTLARFWPETPLEAVASDHTEGFVMATGYVDDGVEAVFLLDALTGNLSARVPSNQSKMYQAKFQGNVYADLKVIVDQTNAQIKAANARSRGGGPPQPEIQLPQQPDYMMTTGAVDIRRGAAARARPSLAAVHVAEVNTGIVMTYVIPWDQAAHAANTPATGAMMLWAFDQFTTPIVQTP